MPEHPKCRAELLGRTCLQLRALHRGPNGKSLQLYAQTLVAVDGLLRAWSGSFRASRCPTTAAEIDQGVNDMVSNFIAFYLDEVASRPQTEKRRALGVHVLADDIQRRLNQQV
jgi:hypothetical protein